MKYEVFGSLEEKKKYVNFYQKAYGHICPTFLAVLRETKEECSNPSGGSLIHCTVGLKIILPPNQQNLCHSSKMISEDLGQRSH